MDDANARRLIGLAGPAGDEPLLDLDRRRALLVGRRALRRRRPAVVRAAVVAVLAVVGLGAVGGTSDPAVGPTRGPLDGPTAGLSVLLPEKGVVMWADGTRVPLGSVGSDPRDMVETPSGYVFHTTKTMRSGQALWFMPYDGPARLVAPAAGEFQVSPDGTTLVASYVDGEDVVADVVAYHLPDLAVLGRRPVFPPVEVGQPAQLVQFNTQIVAVRGQRVWLQEHDPDGRGRAAVWNLDSGELNVTAEQVKVIGVTGAGQVLLGTYATRPQGSLPDNRVCPALLPSAPVLDVPTPGPCESPLGGGIMSPDGRWLLTFQSGSGVHAVQVEDVLAGRLHRAHPIPGGLYGSSFEFWDTGSSFILWHGERLWQGERSPYLRCEVDGQCRALQMLPPELLEWPVYLVERVP